MSKKLNKKYLALKGNASDDVLLSSLKKSVTEAVNGIKSGFGFNGGDEVIIYEVTLRPIKKGKVSVELV
jgi:hypothetical protein